MNLLEGIRAFVHVADLGSFAAAARQLDLSPSAVSKLVTRTEESLSTRLFNRSTRSLSLTLEGRMFLERGRVILRELEAAKLDISSIAEAPSGQLKISMPNITSFFLPVIGRFKDAYPAIDLELDFSDRVVDVIDEGFDVVVRVGQLPDSRLTSRLIGNFTMQLVASPRYLERHGVPISVADLRNHQCIQYRYPSTGRLEVWPVLEASGGSLIADTQLVCNNADARLGLALQGRGIAFMPSLLADPYLDSGELLTVLPDDVRQVYGLHLLWPTNKHATPRLREFTGYFHQYLAQAAKYVR